MIYQVVESLAYGDAIGNDVLSIDRLLRREGFETQILAGTVDARLASRANLFQPQIPGPEDVVLYHKASGDALAGQVSKLPCKKVLLYHNITPARFFAPYDKLRAWRLRQGHRQVKALFPVLDAVWGVSSYNLQELEAMGCPVRQRAILPILLDFAQYAEPADPFTLQKLRARPGTKLLFVGRIAPNKCQEDILSVFLQYKRTVDAEAQLYLVGSERGMEKYYAKLQGLVAELRLRDVYFAGHVPFRELLAYYRGCDVFVCMSEHEGFCVPLLECMYFHLPIVAYASSAVPETLSGSGVLLREKRIGAFCAAIERLQTDGAYRERIVAEQEEVLRSRYQGEKAEAQLYALVRALTGPEMPGEAEGSQFPELSRIRNRAYYRAYLRLLPRRYGRILRKVGALAAGRMRGRQT